MIATLRMITLSLAAALIFAACEDNNNGNNDNAGPAENEVWMQNNAFDPETLNISKGTTVKWINKDDADHTVTSSDGFFDSKTVAGGDTFQHTFDSTGIYDYVCTIHSGMSGTVNVDTTSTNDDSNDDGGGDGY
jgi:plastocyanin